MNTPRLTEAQWESLEAIGHAARIGKGAFYSNAHRRADEDGAARVNWKVAENLERKGLIEIQGATRRIVLTAEGQNMFDANQDDT